MPVNHITSTQRFELIVGYHGSWVELEKVWGVSSGEWVSGHGECIYPAMHIK